MRCSTSLLVGIFSLIPTLLVAQTTRVSGRVTDQAGLPLAAVRVAERGTVNSTLTTSEGRYDLRVSGADAVIRFERAGYRAEERTMSGSALDVSMTQELSMAAIEVVGTRRLDRAPTNTAVPVDVIDITAAVESSGQMNINSLLQYVAPSFNANRQSGADGSDHIDPASLRGLGPDQTLVLINGKRRHQSSLVNIFGSRGRGNTGTDLNSIPVHAIERIEILRDGASAQYGSDAIAGVINIVLKSGVGEFAGEVMSGVHNASAPSNLDITSSGTDGQQLRVGGNYGFRISDQGFLNLTGEFLTTDHTNRPIDPAKYDLYRRHFGDAALDNGGAFLNALLPLGENRAVYAFGGASLRKTDAYAWTRDPDDTDRNIPSIYPDGFDPRIVTNIRDLSLSAGVRSQLGKWNLDLNSTTGSNRMHYNVEGTLNASFGPQSPTEFDAGGFSLLQSTTGIHLNRLMENVASGLNVAVGAEHRYERYSIFAGEEGSYRNYGNGAAGGSQGFPGFQPADEIAEGRSNVGGYVDLELDATERLTLGAAGRFEHYSDFGNTMTAKGNARLALTDAVALRGSVSTGFRAPSLAQIYFNSTFTDVVSGSIVDKVIARNNSRVAHALGIPSLTEEKSVSAGAGFTARAGNFSLAVDGYIVNIDDRIVLTGAFDQEDPDIGDELSALNVSAAQFFTNAIDTKTKGLDVVLAHQAYFRNHQLRSSLVGNFNEMELGSIHTNQKLKGKEETYFGAREQAFLIASAPGRKLSLAFDHSYSRFESQLRFTNFGKVTLMDWNETDDVYESRTVTDLSVGYRLSNNLRLTVGGNNIFNKYPTQQPDTETETGGLFDAVQMGFSGAFYFAKLSIRL